MYSRPTFCYFATLVLLLNLLIPVTANASLSIWGFEESPRPAQTTNEQTIVTDKSVFNPDPPLSIWGFDEEPAEKLESAVKDSEISDDVDPPLREREEINEPTDVQAFSDQPPSEVTYDIPIVSNKHVLKYITLFQTRLRPNFEKWLSRSGRYIPMIQKTLRENQLPEDLVYLALIESGFNPKAHSRSKASGVWQFMKGTGRRYGLRIDRWIDERRDPVKSTKAAAKYLTELYDMFGVWPLALAAYNAGESRVYKTIVRVRTRDFWTLRKSRHFRPETRNYVPKFMAATIIAKDPGRYQFSVQYDSPFQYDEVEIQNATYLSAIARHAGISVKELKQYNPELKQNVTPPRFPGYRIKLPSGKKEVFLASYSPEKEEKIFIGRSFKHRVRRGETISSIAQQYGVSVNLLLETNQLHSRSIIRVGQHVLINESPTRMGGKHLIRRGDTISLIASKYHVSIRRLLEANQLHKKSVIRAGHALIIPGARIGSKKPGHPAANQNNQKKHRIRTGESISTIAQKYAVRMRDLLKVNQLTKKSIIRAGRTLIIP